MPDVPLPAGSANQFVRIAGLKRYFMALTAYGVCVGLLAIANDLGLIGGLPAVIAAVAMLVVNGGVFALIRSGLNERFGDPSLTWFQVISRCR